MADHGPHGGSDARVSLLRLSNRAPPASRASSSSLPMGRAMFPESSTRVSAASAFSLKNSGSLGFASWSARAVSSAIDTGTSSSAPFSVNRSGMPGSARNSPLSTVMRASPWVFGSRRTMRPPPIDPSNWERDSMSPEPARAGDEVEAELAERGVQISHQAERAQQFADVEVGREQPQAGRRLRAAQIEQDRAVETGVRNIGRERGRIHVPVADSAVERDIAHFDGRAGESLDPDCNVRIGQVDPLRQQRNIQHRPLGIRFFLFRLRNQRFQFPDVDLLRAQPYCYE